MHAFKLKHPVPDLQPIGSVSLLGATPTPIPAPEMYSALHTGVVDAMEFLVDKLKGSKNNADFFDSMNKN